MRHVAYQAKQVQRPALLTLCICTYSITVKPTPLSHNPPQMSRAIWEAARFKYLYFDLCVWVLVAK